MRRRPVRPRLTTAITFGLLLSPLLSAGTVVAAEYGMSTVVRYVVDPVAGQIAVTVEVTFTNTTPNPPGQVSGFDRIDIALHEGASQVTARDSSGSLTVAVETRDGMAVASVKARSRVRYNQSASFTLSYRLTDASAPSVHVRAEVVKFPVYGFGTSSQVTVDVPTGYQVLAGGDPMTTTSDGGVLHLTSGPIAQPNKWLALVAASRPLDYTTQSASVALASGTLDLQVRAWSGDQAWGERTLALLVAALPRLEEAIGLPYSHVGPLVVTEAVGGEGTNGELPSSNAEIQVGFDEPAFTLLHQAAHIWISNELAADRWIREGLASHYAEQLAAGLKVALPYDPALRAAELVADARPLAAWGAQAASAPGDAYAYAASWASVDRIARDIGEARLTDALRRVVAGLSAYEPALPDPLPASERQFAPVDTRRLIDQLAAASGIDLADRFAPEVLGPEAAPELADRATARSEYQRLAAAGGDWGVPDPIQADMGAWRFAEARVAIAEAVAWLVERDALIAKIAKAGLTTPNELRSRFAVDGGGAKARSELAAERAVVDPYLELRRRADTPRGPLEAIGLLAAVDPRQLLAEAATRFGDGDLRTAVAVLDRAELQLDHAAANGLVRLASAIVLLAVIALLVSRTTRHRGGSHYTAGP